MAKKSAVMLGLCLVGAGTVLFWPQSDERMAALLVGTWQASDPSNAALHGRKEPVAREVAKFAANGTVLYRVWPTHSPTATQSVEKIETPWGWKISKGRLFLKDAGAESTGEWIAAVKIKVSPTSLSMNRKGWPTKTFTRSE